MRRVPAARQRHVPRSARRRLTAPEGVAAALANTVRAPADATLAIEVAEDVGRRLRDPAAVDESVESARRQQEARLVHWRPEGLWQGYAGLTLLSAALDAVAPGAGWDRVGHEQLARAGRGLEGRPARDVGLARGLSGVGFGTWALSRGGTRYARLLRTVDAALVGAVEARVSALLSARPHGVGVATFDVIAGLTGAGRYLLERREEPVLGRTLRSVLAALAYLSEEDGDGVPHWYTAPGLLTSNFLRASYPDGHVNLGLAHGIAGPLALLSLAMVAGVEVEGQREAIGRAASWLERSRLHDEWGVTFPAVVSIGGRVADGGADEGHGAAAPAPPSRSAWCYGAPGVARALWLAGTATGCAAYRDLALEAMGAVYRRPPPARRIDSPTLCHGVAGLLQVTVRFRDDVGAPGFDAAAHDLTAQLLGAREPASRFGFRNLEPNGGRVDHPGMLDGAAGVALALLGAAGPIEPAWDAVLLLS